MEGGWARGLGFSGWVEFVGVGISFDVAKLAGFKSGDVVKATISRGLPHFARLAVVLWEGEETNSTVNGDNKIE